MRTVNAESLIHAHPKCKFAHLLYKRDYITLVYKINLEIYYISILSLNLLYMIFIRQNMHTLS